MVPRICFTRGVGFSPNNLPAILKQRKIQKLLIFPTCTHMRLFSRACPLTCVRRRKESRRTCAADGNDDDGDPIVLFRSRRRPCTCVFFRRKTSLASTGEPFLGAREREGARAGSVCCRTGKRTKDVPIKVDIIYNETSHLLKTRW